MKSAIEAFPVSEEEAEDIDKLRDTFPDKADLRAVLEDYFHIYDDYAKMSAQEFDMYFEDYMEDYEEPEFVEDISLRNSVIKSAVNNSKNLKISNVKVDPKWIYDTFKGSLIVHCTINNIPAEFKFEAARWDDMLSSGIDCNDVRVSKDGATNWNGTFKNYSTITVSNGGSQTRYALYIDSDTLKSKPKANQKDFRFTGQYYSTSPVASAFKSQLTSLFRSGNLTDEFVNYFNPQSEIESSMKRIESGRVEHYRDAYLGGLMSREDFKKNLLEEGYDDELADYLIDKMCSNSIACSKKTVVESLIKSGYSKKEAEDIYEKSRV